MYTRYMNVSNVPSSNVLVSIFFQILQRSTKNARSLLTRLHFKTALIGRGSFTSISILMNWSCLRAAIAQCGNPLRRTNFTSRSCPSLLFQVCVCCSSIAWHGVDCKFCTHSWRSLRNTRANRTPSLSWTNARCGYSSRKEWSTWTDAVDTWKLACLSYFSL